MSILCTVTLTLSLERIVALPRLAWRYLIACVKIFLSQLSRLNDSRFSFKFTFFFLFSLPSLFHIFIQLFYMLLFFSFFFSANLVKELIRVEKLNAHHQASLMSLMAKSTYANKAWQKVEHIVYLHQEHSSTLCKKSVMMWHVCIHTYIWHIQIFMFHSALKYLNHRQKNKNNELYVKQWI